MYNLIRAFVSICIKLKITRFFFFLGDSKSKIKDYFIPKVEKIQLECDILSDFEQR